MSFRNQTGPNYIPEINRLIEEIRTEPLEVKESVSTELKSAYIKYSDRSEMIFDKLRELIEKPDINCKLGGLIAIEHLASVVQETDTMAFVTKFLSIVFAQFTCNEDIAILQRTANVFGKLLSMGEAKITQPVEMNIDEVFKWLKSDSFKEIRKFAGILALKQMLTKAPYIAFNKIFMNEKSFDLIWNIIREKRLNLREVALEFMHLFIQNISHREISLQKGWVDRIDAKIKDTKNSSEPEIIHGNIIMLGSLLAYIAFFSKTEDEIREIIQYILSHKNNRQQYIQIAVIKTIPILAKFKPEVFYKNYFTESLTFLLKFGLQAKNEEKAVCYETLASLFESIEVSFLESFMTTVKDHFTTALKKKFKPFCPQVIKALDSLRVKLGKKFKTQFDMEYLSELILINGLYPESLKFLGEVCKMMEESSAHEQVNLIQLKVLMAISWILSGEIYKFHGRSGIYVQEILRFKQSLTTELDNKNEAENTEAKALALQALATFSFCYYVDPMAMFVLEIVLKHLDHGAPVIRKAAAKAGSLLHFRKTYAEGVIITSNHANDVLGKFLSVCLSDPDTSVRETMLASLNKNFDVFLDNPKYLKMLLACLNDPNYKVQANSLRIVCRLIKFGPSEIVPYIKKKIFQSLNALIEQHIYNEEEKIEILSLLTCIIEDAADLIIPHIDTLCVTMISMFNDPKTSNNIIPHILTCLRKLSGAIKQGLLPYLNDFFHILIQCMQDMSSSTKRETSVKTITQLIKNTGYVILPYYKYPNLLGTLLYLLKSETYPEIRTNLLKLMGALGALDAFFYKKIQLRLTEGQSRFSLNEILAQDFKYPFIINKRIEEGARSQHKVDLIKFYNDLLIVNEIDKKKKLTSAAKTFHTQTLLDNQLKLEEHAYNERYMQKTHINNSEIEDLLNEYTPINLSSPDYYIRVTVKSLLRVLCDPALSQHHHLIVEALSCILESLKSRFANFLDLVIPVFIHLIQTVVNLRESLIAQLELIIHLCDSKFPGEFVEPILELALTYVKQPEGDIMRKCFELILTLVRTSKVYLRHQMGLITTKLNQILNSFEDVEGIVRNILFIYTELGGLLDTYLEDIIALLTKIVRNCSLTNSDSLIRIIEFFNICISTCPSTVQHLSKIVHSLTFVLEIDPTVREPIVGCFVNMMWKFKDDFLMYLPLVNSYISKYHIKNDAFQKCIELLLTRDSLEEITNIFSRNEPSFRMNGDEFSKLDSQGSFAGDESYINQPILPRTTNMDDLLKKFQTGHKDLEKDWIEWMRKSSLELLKQNPYPILNSCYPIAEVYPPIAKELYNVAFVTCWCMLNSKQQDQMDEILENALKNTSTPIHVLQTILNLAEFMQHERQAIPIDIPLLAASAERCQAFAKALYYRELEFEISPGSSVEPLVKLYVSLGYPEAANDMMVYAKNTGIKVETTWLEALGRWEEALPAYNAKTETDEDYFVNKMRCLNAMSDWEMLMDSCEPLMADNEPESLEKRKNVIQLAANAALNLNEWDKLEKYTEKMEESFSQDTNFFQAIINLRKGKFDQSLAFIHKSREVLDSKVSGLLLESYSRAYSDVIKLQQLSEMEEIIEFKKEENRILIEEGETKEMLALSPNKMMVKIGQEVGTHRVKSIQALKNQLIEKWNDRLNGCQPSIDIWQMLLSVRSILLPKHENLDSWLRLCKLCMKQSQIKICHTTLESIKKDLLKVYLSEDKLPPKLVLMSMECDYARGILDLKGLIKNMIGYLGLQAGKEINELKSKYYLKLGNFLKKEQEKMSGESIKEILAYYTKATEYDKENYKAWHFLGLMNFEAVEYYKNLPEKPGTTMLLPYVKASLEGFIQAISLGASSMPTSKSFQDTLRLLTLWFNFGSSQSVNQMINDSFKSISLASWIEVVPQLIARFDISIHKIRETIHFLLKKIGASHPQALIYPLTVAHKEKMNARKDAAEGLLKDMKGKNEELINQALVISEELCRTAILLKEQWADAIREATRYYQNRDYQTMRRILMPYHENMKKPPETLSEIAFHQAFKQELAEAEAWLMRFLNTQDNPDEYSINHAWDLYHSIYRRIAEKLTNLNTVYLENVAPKLLTTKNTILSIPGLYSPNKPLITIAGFAATLEVLPSKQRPRKLTIFGSNGKEYTFLLKGHEDTRQDERVMQLFSLVNRIMATESTTKKKDLSITRYSVVPLSTTAGLIGWVHNSDPMQKLIREYRESFNIVPNAEMKLLNKMCQNFAQLSLINKIEVFQNMLDKTKGEDLKNVFWLKSPNSEVWLERRTSYTRSLATMSMVGYVLGLGDRHPSNIMLQRISGKILHIDFGDCFEVAMKRDEVPERVPFRLTRMLVKVMEACSIEGTYRATCEDVMGVLRNNKDSLIAVLQAFVYDPLVNWRLLTPSDAKPEGTTMADVKLGEPPLIRSLTGLQKNMSDKSTGRKLTIMETGKKKTVIMPGLDMETADPIKVEIDLTRDNKVQLPDEENNTEKLNHRAVEVIDRIKNKLTGRDFKETEVLTVVSQVDKLIRQATSVENICQSFIGWCPFW